ncbi:MAG: hypothetical protein U0P45_03815 [Acidimicrobiales bacterium]
MLRARRRAAAIACAAAVALAVVGALSLARRTAAPPTAPPTAPAAAAPSARERAPSLDALARRLAQVRRLRVDPCRAAPHELLRHLGLDDARPHPIADLAARRCRWVGSGGAVLVSVRRDRARPPVSGRPAGPGRRLDVPGAQWARVVDHPGDLVGWPSGRTATAALGHGSVTVEVATRRPGPMPSDPMLAAALARAVLIAPPSVR